MTGRGGFARRGFEALDPGCRRLLSRRPAVFHSGDRQRECCPGAEVAESAGTEELTEAYGIFRQEALDVNVKYSPPREWQMEKPSRAPQPTPLS
jgi:hypothetical protein